MKNRKIVMLLFLNIFVMSLAAQSFDDASGKLKTAFKAGDYSSLSVLFSDSVDLTVLDTDGIYSKTQAKGVLRNFFEKNKAKSFEIKHQGSSNDGTVYAIGLYVSDKGSYRVYALLKEIGGSAKIVQLQIEEEL